MPYNRSTYIAGEREPSVHLKCGNVRLAFLLFCMIFWLFSLIMLCQMAAHRGFQKLRKMHVRLIIISVITLKHLWLVR